MEHGNDFLSEWYDWETEEQPVVPDAGPDAVFLDVPVFHGPDEIEVKVPEVPIPHGPDVCPPIPEPLAVVRRSTHPSKPPDRY